MGSPSMPAGGGIVPLDVIVNAIRQVRTSVRTHPGVLSPEKEKALLKLLDKMEASIDKLCPRSPKGVYFMPPHNYK